MELSWLEVFREVAARGSLTSAGQALGYTQSAVSRQVSALENATGTRLFDRLPRGVRLTEEGHCLLAHAETILERMRSAQQALKALRDLDAGQLRVSAFDSADTALVPTALAAFRAAHPKVALSVVEAVTTLQLDRLRSGETDVAVLSAYPHRPLDASQLDLHHLLNDPLLVALPAGHRLAHRRRLRLADLENETWIEGFPDTSQTLLDACQRAGFRPQIEFAIREWTAKQGFVAAGLGVTLVPSLQAGAIRSDITLARLHPHDTPVRTVHAATLHGIANPPPVAAFLKCLATTQINPPSIRQRIRVEQQQRRHVLATR